MSTLKETTERLLNFSAMHFNVPAGQLTPEDDLFQKLGVDSIQAQDLLSLLEYYFGVELPDYELQHVSDFRTLAERIHSRL